MNKIYIILVLLISFHNVSADNLFQPYAILGIKSDVSFSKFIKDYDINSPKSVIFSDDGSSFYIQSLEGGKTINYETSTLKKLWSTNHKFSKQVQKEHQYYYNYPFFQHPKEYTGWSGKPVEAVFDNNEQLLYVSSYRKSFDNQGVLSSYVAVIDASSGSIIWSIPSDAIPKVLALSNNNNLLAVTSWGENSVTIWEKDEDYRLKLLHHLQIAPMPDLSAVSTNRDINCGLCLRGTIFSPNDEYLLTSGLHGGGYLYKVDVRSGSIKRIKVPFYPIRHIAYSVYTDKYYFSTTLNEQICSIDEEIIAKSEKNDSVSDRQYKCKKVNSAVRSIAVAENIGVAALNSKCQVAIFDLTSLDILQTLPAPCYPVGIAISPDEDWIVVTSQGKNGNGGHKVGVYKRGKSSN